METVGEQEGAALGPDRARVASFRAFLRCGGAVTLAEWRVLSRPDVLAFLEAAAQVEAERAGRVAEALELREQGARVDAALDRAVQSAVKRG